MMSFFVCAGLLGLLAVALLSNVGRVRGKTKIFIGATRVSPNLLSVLLIVDSAQPALWRSIRITNPVSGLQIEKSRYRGRNWCCSRAETKLLCDSLHGAIVGQHFSRDSA